MLNKGIISVLCAFTTASTAISIGNAFSSLPSTQNSDDLLYSEYYVESEINSQCASEYKYILKEDNGNIAVIDVNGNVVEVFDVSTVTLPMTERKKLETGIKVKSDNELNTLREAYCG